MSCISFSFFFNSRAICVNLCYGFTNPKDPSKEQTLQGSKKEKELFKDYEALDKILHKQVANKIINSRDELIYFLEQNNIEVTRKGIKGN
ncbi:hypothetical protein OMM78_001818 [Campylobacter coli]|nr:hypothetical protein [Campylobacter coli]ELN5489375.1 hypothetical protein [Campylobacter coli]ELW9645939.1 hypothetical protein [Campylobacter coli]